MTRPRHTSLLREFASSILLLLATGLVVAASPPEPAATSAELQFKNVKRPLEGVASGGQPTEDEFRQAAAVGYKTIVNLRTEGEVIPFDEPALIEALGLAYVHLPIAGAADITSENAAALAKVLDDAERPVLLHCGSGNRIGALLALDAHERLGQDAETALQTGLDAGLTRLEPVVRDKLGLPVPESD